METKTYTTEEAEIINAFYGEPKFVWAGEIVDWNHTMQLVEMILGIKNLSI